MREDPRVMATEHIFRVFLTAGLTQYEYEIMLYKLRYIREDLAFLT